MAYASSRSSSSSSSSSPWDGLQPGCVPQEHGQGAADDETTGESQLQHVQTEQQQGSQSGLDFFNL